MAFGFFDAVDDAAALSVLHADFVVVSSEGADSPLYAPLVPLLQRVQQGLGMQVLFITQFLGGAPVPRSAGHDPSEAEFGAHLLAGQGRSFAAPVIGRDGRHFGTVCCGERRGAVSRRTTSEPQALQSIARILALALSRGEAPEEVGDSVWASSAAAPLGLA